MPHQTATLLVYINKCKVVIKESGRTVQCELS